MKENVQDKWRKDWSAKGWDVIQPSFNFGNIAAEPNRPYVYIGDGAGLGNFDYIYVGDKLNFNPAHQYRNGRRSLRRSGLGNWIRRADLQLQETKNLAI